LPGEERYEVLRLPALAEAEEAEGPDPLGRAPGEALWPQRFSVRALDAKRRELGSAVFEGLYQGRPRPVQGVIFHRDWFRFFRPVTDGFDLGSRIVARGECQIFCTVDLADTLDTSADYTVVATFARTPQGELLLVDLLRRRLESTGHLPMLKAAWDRHRPVFIGVETDACGRSVTRLAKQQGLRIKPLRADKDKQSRALAAAVMFEAGDVYLPERASFLDDLQAELLAFPRGRHDDQVDAIAYGALCAAEFRCGRAYGMSPARHRIPLGPWDWNRFSDGLAWRDRDVARRTLRPMDWH
jgi:predicted phage terminase large subunit-like protein